MRRRLFWPLFWGLLGALLAACTRDPRTPADAYNRLLAAVASRDGQALFDSFDRPTQWAWMTVQRAHREAYDVVLSNFPAPGRASILRRFADGALSESAAALFARRAAPALWQPLAAHTRGGIHIAQPTADEATVQCADGATLLFRRDHKRWGYAGEFANAKLAEMRALADLENVRLSATDFERALARGGP